MMKPHCDNCDAVIIDANPSRYVSVEPLGFQCVVSVKISKEEDLELCAACLRAAVLAFADSLQVSTPRPSIGISQFGDVADFTTSLDAVATRGGKASVETRQ